MITVGVLVRAHEEDLDSVEKQLLELEDVTGSIELEEPGTIGIVLQGSSLNEVHLALTERVQRIEGVLAAWPLHTELGDVPERSPQATSPSRTNH